MTQARWLVGANADTAEIPAYSLVKVTSTDVQGRFDVAEPDAADNVIYVVGDLPIPAADDDGDGIGAITGDWPAWAAYDADDGTPAIGETWGHEAGTFLLKKDAPGFRIVSDPDEEQEIVRVERAGGGDGCCGWCADETTVAVGEGGSVHTNFTVSGPFDIENAGGSPDRIIVYLDIEESVLVVPVGTGPLELTAALTLQAGVFTSIGSPNVLPANADIAVFAAIVDLDTGSQLVPSSSGLPLPVLAGQTLSSRAIGNAFWTDNLDGGDNATWLWAGSAPPVFRILPGTHVTELRLGWQLTVIVGLVPAATTWVGYIHAWGFGGGGTYLRVKKPGEKTGWCGA